MGMKLFENSDVSDEDLSKIEINKEFARRYEHNKKWEDLQRLEELKKKGLVEDSSDTDSNDESLSGEAAKDELINSKQDLEFLNALIKVKNHDPELKNKETKLFEADDEEDEEEEENEEARGKGEKGKRDKKGDPLYLRDVTARLLIEEGPEFEEKEEKSRVKSYLDEQEDHGMAVYDATEKFLEVDDDGEVVKMKEIRSTGDEEDDGDDDDTGEVQKKLDEYFGKDDNLDENEMFLKEYFRNRMWVDEGKGMKAVDEEASGFSEEEEEIEKQEDYERDFNFRFEENAGDRVLGHSRFIEGSVRKKTSARKVQRKSKEERMAQAEFERKEELKHLKNLKKKEMKEMLRKIRDTAGIGENWVCPLDEDDLEEEFDPEDYDRKMKEAFNDDYYDANDVDPEFGSDKEEDGGEFEKPDFDKEDELLGLPKGWNDLPGSGDGFLAVRERNLKRRAENEGYQENIKEEKVVPEEGKLNKKQKMSNLEKEIIDKELEEYYKLDYEDTIGDLKTRFKYKEVGAKRYGLRTEEILVLDDKELNEYVSLKKLAPYREKEWKVPRNVRHKYKQKHMNKLLLQETSNDQKTGKKKLRIDNKKSTRVLASEENEKEQVVKSNGDMSNPSRRSRRRHRQAALKLSQLRLMAYGKIPSKSKSKKKH